MFYAFDDVELDRATQLISTLPGSTYSMLIHYIPNPYRLPSLPVMDWLSIHARREETKEMTSTLFLRLIESHKDLEISAFDVALSWHEFARIVQIISEDKRERHIFFTMSNPTILSCLRAHGVSATTKSGQVSGEFTIVEHAAEAPMQCARLIMSNECSCN
ncbi:hypothetical protein PENTCL1PPCAC_20437 [Pristionchus entomophagus]|uniref:Uncharacterized protein n=1 Tax=Pristionchus entomophagus TaxID=358040 RepID=A0AAV5TV14_9BILA|nr:hypothetical protein PENTCL1PPCAC_20437 [Pristionchus entomophagus]